MPQTHIPPQLLQQSDKILIIAHLALGDFTYLQNSLRALANVPLRSGRFVGTQHGLVRRPNP